MTSSETSRRTSPSCSSSELAGELVDRVPGGGRGVELARELELEAQAPASAAESTNRSRSSMRVISKTRCTSGRPRTSVERAVLRAGALVGEHDHPQAGGVHELEPDRSRTRAVASWSADDPVELVLEQRRAGDVELAGQRDDRGVAGDRGLKAQQRHARETYESRRRIPPSPMARLRRADCSGPGIQRVRRGRGFSYVDADGGKVDEPEVLGAHRASW